VGLPAKTAGRLPPPPPEAQRRDNPASHPPPSEVACPPSLDLRAPATAGTTLPPNHHQGGEEPHRVSPAPEPRAAETTNQGHPEQISVDDDQPHWRPPRSPSATLAQRNRPTSPPTDQIWERRPPLGSSLGPWRLPPHPRCPPRAPRTARPPPPDARVVETAVRVAGGADQRSPAWSPLRRLRGEERPEQRSFFSRLLPVPWFSLSTSRSTQS
jgi:hypothetical protein